MPRAPESPNDVGEVAAVGAVGDFRVVGVAPADRLRFMRGTLCSSPGGSSGRPPDMAGRACSVNQGTAAEQWR
eukprot:1617083-Alexandrium_andersonii.AAC.1